MKEVFKDLNSSSINLIFTTLIALINNIEHNNVYKIPKNQKAILDSIYNDIKKICHNYK